MFSIQLRVRVQFELLTKAEADDSPVGEVLLMKISTKFVVYTEICKFIFKVIYRHKMSPIGTHIFQTLNVNYLHGLYTAGRLLISLHCAGNIPCS